MRARNYYWGIHNWLFLLRKYGEAFALPSYPKSTVKHHCKLYRMRRTWSRQILTVCMVYDKIFLIQKSLV